MVHHLVKNLCPAVKCWAAKPHGCMVPCSCLAPSHAQAGQDLARDGHPWEGLDGSWFGKGVSQPGHDHPGWGSGMGRDLALVLGLSKLHPKLLLDEPSKSKVLSLFYMVIPHLPTQDCTLLLQQIQGWSSQMFPPPPPKYFSGFKTQICASSAAGTTFALMTKVLVKPLLWTKQPEKSLS